MVLSARFQQRALTTFATALGATTVLGWFGRLHAWFEMLTNIAPHLLVLSLILVTWAAFARRRLPLAIGAIAALWFLLLLVPYVFASPDAAPSDPDRLHVALQYNVYFGNDDIDRIVDEITSANADVIALHEITGDQWIAVAERLPAYEAIALPWDGSDPQLGGGMAIMSREPLTAIPVDPSASIVGRPIIAAITTIGGTETVVVGLHPHASRFESHKVELRNAQLDAVAKLLSSEDRPAIILADLNMTPTSSDYRSFLNDLDWRDPHRDTGWDASWPTWGGPFGLPIDHVIVSNSIALHDISSAGGGGSDHRSLTAEFSFGR